MKNSTLRFTVDRHVIDGVFGWAYDGDDVPARVSLNVNGQSIKEASANVYRSDLVAVSGHGRCAFIIRTSPDFWAMLHQSDEVSVSVLGHDSSILINHGGSAPNKFPLRNRAGERNSLNKDGYVGPKFVDRTPEYLHGLLEFTSEVVDRLGSEGFQCSLAYGTLLGALRSSDFIPHDDDIDLSCHCPIDNPADQQIDDFTAEIAGRLTDVGMTVARYSSGHIKVMREGFGLDIFASWNKEGRFFLNFALKGKFASSRFFPLSVLEIRGRSFPSPHQPEEVCEALYGPDWRVPVVEFNWVRSEQGVDEPLRDNSAYWNGYYRRAVTPLLPSQFAVFVAGEFSDSPAFDVAIEFGCGSGRDLGALAGIAERLIGIDASQAALDVARQQVQSAETMSLNVADNLDLRRLRHLVAGTSGRILLYSRFFLHAVQKIAEDNLLRMAAEMASDSEVVLAHEYRVSADADGEKVTPAHFRRFLSHDGFLEKLTALGFVIDYEVTGRGMAKYKSDDAVVGRVIARSPKF